MNGLATSWSYKIKLHLRITIAISRSLNSSPAMEKARSTAKIRTVYAGNVEAMTKSC